MSLTRQTGRLPRNGVVAGGSSIGGWLRPSGERGPAIGGFEDNVENRVFNIVIGVGVVREAFGKTLLDQPVGSGGCGPGA